MARFPQGFDKLHKRANEGERRVLATLKRQLEDDYTVWHDTPIMGSGRQPDLVLLHPQRGLLVLEVKHWRASTLVDCNPMTVTLNLEGQPIQVDHPLAQARGYAIDLEHALRKMPGLLQTTGRHAGRLVLPWGFGAVLSHIKNKDALLDSGFEAVFPADQVMLADDLADDVIAEVFQQRLWGMFRVSFACQLSLPQMQLVRGTVFPELRLGEQATLPFMATPSRLVVQDLLRVMDLGQEEVARNLGDGHRVVHGPAGSGKTMILVFRALQLQAAASAEKPILVLCYNVSLAGRLEFLLRAKGAAAWVQVRTFHSWADELVRTYQLHDAKASHRSGEDRYQAIAALACEGIAARRVPRGQYTSILIDEAHDWDDAWLAAAAHMVNPVSNSLLVMYDDAQSIYQTARKKKLVFSQVGIQARGRTDVLKINDRNTTQVLHLAMLCATELFEGASEAEPGDTAAIVPSSAGRSGPVPRLLQTTDRTQEAAAMAQAVQGALELGVSLNEVAVIARTKVALQAMQGALKQVGVVYQSQNDVDSLRQMHWAAPSVKLLTIHSAKGLEFRFVGIFGLDLMPMKGESLIDELRLVYVGMTRATHHLVLSASAASPVVQRVADALATMYQEA